MKLVFTNDPASSIPFDAFTFHGGESHVRLTDPAAIRDDANRAAPRGLTVIAKLKSGDDVMQLLMARDAIRNAGGADYPVRLRMAYIPYARQDRICNEGEALSIRVFADLINSLGFTAVEIVDPHSDVSAALLRHAQIIKQHQVIAASINAGLIPDADDFLIVAPDLGALKKIRDIPGEKVVCDKIRRLSDGHILGIRIAEGNPRGRKCLIIDDICDGGRTFIETARALREAGAASVALHVTHGIFSAGFDELRQHLDFIVTTDSWCDEGTRDGFVRVLPLASLNR